MSSLESIQEKIRQYLAGPDALRAGLQGLDEAGLDSRYSDDTWSIRSYVHHVVDGDELWKFGIRAALGTNSGAFALRWYWDMPQVEWGAAWGYATRPVEPALALLEMNRRQVLEVLPPDEALWQRSVLVHWPSGRQQPLSVEEIIAMQIRHVTGHLQDIGAIRALHAL